MDFFRHDLALTQKSTFDFRIRATKPREVIVVMSQCGGTGRK